MQKVGKQVHFIYTSKDNPRKGEGSFVRLKNGRILYAYTNFYSGNYTDYGEANICACYSDDEGETWSESFVLLEKDPEAVTYYMSTFLRLANGQLAMMILRKHKEGEQIVCRPMLLRSDDEAKTWSAPEDLGLEQGYYYVSVNDSVEVFADGRIYLPMSRYRPDVTDGSVIVACSEDNGYTWYLLPVALKSTYADAGTFAEPGIFEHADGKLWLYFRIAYGFQYHSISEDGGQTWTPAEPNFCFPSAESPMRVKRVGEYVVAVSNPSPYTVLHPLLDKRIGWDATRRTPLVCAFDKNDGKNFSRRGIMMDAGALKPIIENTLYLENNEEDKYCYPAIIGVEDGFLVAYYHGNGDVRCLNCSKILKVTYEEIEACGL